MGKLNDQVRNHTMDKSMHVFYEDCLIDGSISVSDVECFCFLEEVCFFIYDIALLLLITQKYDQY